MSNDVELALLAGAGYESNRDDINMTPLPSGWSALQLSTWPLTYGSQSKPSRYVAGRVYWQDLSTGFEAAAYTKGNEVVITFAGTNFDDEKATDLLQNNIPLGAGKITPQLKQAAEFVARVLRDPAMAGKSITLTGHSLGGGLASVMAVMFDLPAVTFDPAPFRAVATTANAQQINSVLQQLGLGLNAKVATFESSGAVPVPVGAWLRLFGPVTSAAASALGIPAFVDVPTTVLRENNVRAIAVKGEFLSSNGVDLNVREKLRIYGGQLAVIDHIADGASMTNLHSQTLLTLLLESTQGSANSGFYRAARAFESFLPIFFDKKVFPAQLTKEDARTPLEHLMRHHFGVAPNSPNGAAPVVADRMLDALGTDLDRLGVPKEDFLLFYQQGVLESVLRHYYTAVSPQQTPERYGTDGKLKPLLSTITGGVSFLASEVEAPGGRFRSWDRFSQSILEQTLLGLPQLDNRNISALVRAQVSRSEQVSVASSGDLIVAREGDAKADLALGGRGADNLQTGGGADLLFTSDGADTLAGGTGDDLLMGGNGSDTYTFTDAWGKDVILDLDGQGVIQIGGQSIGAAVGAGRAGQWAFNLGAGVFANLALYDNAGSTTGKRLVITKGADSSNTITVENFDLARAQSGEGYLGIKLDNKPKLALVQTTGSNVWTDPNFNFTSLANQSSSFIEATTEHFTIYLSQAAKAGNTLMLALSAQPDKLKAVLGDDTVAANGAVIPLAEGQTQVSFALVQEGEITANASTQLSVKYTSADETATSNAWTVNLVDAGAITQTSNGDQRAKIIGTEIDIGATQNVGTYKWSATSWGADGMLVGGLAACTHPAA